MSDLSVTTVPRLQNHQNLDQYATFIKWQINTVHCVIIYESSFYNIQYTSNDNTDYQFLQQTTAYKIFKIVQKIRKRFPSIFNHTRSLINMLYSNISFKHCKGSIQDIEQLRSLTLQTHFSPKTHCNKLENTVKCV